MNNHLKKSSARPYVLITSNMYKPSIGGIENSLYHLAQEYKKRNYEVIIVTSDINDLGLELPEYEVLDEINIYRYRAHAGRGVFGFSRHVFNAFYLYKKILKNFQPSIVICRYHFNLVLLKLAGCDCISYLIPGVVKNETQASMIQETKFLPKLRAKLSFDFHQWLQKKAIKDAESLFVFSQNMLSQTLDITSRTDIKVTKPGVSLSRFFPLNKSEKSQIRQTLNLPTDRQVMLCIGRHVKAKGFESVIRAVAKANLSNIELWIVGDGPLTSYLEELIVELQCPDQVKLLGRQQCPEKFYQAADAFIMSSVYEPLGQTILEALATGLPIIAAASSATVITASSEIIDSSHNIMTNTHSVESFLQSIIVFSELSEREYQVMSEYNRTQAETRFTWSALAEDLIPVSLKISSDKTESR
ncbi:MAG: 1,2-diacylglycerol 3-alpha-glucosyltransferase [Alteromonadaceae bacterium]